MFYSVSTCFVNLKFASPCTIIQFKYINQLDTTTSQVYYLTLCTAVHVLGVLTPIIRSSTTAVQPLVLPLEHGGSSAVGRARASRPDHDQQRCYHHAPTVKPEAVTAVVELLMMGVRMPETC